MCLPPAIPIIDFSPFLNDSPSACGRVAILIDDALRTAGFLYLTNYGIDESKINQAFDWSRRFFALTDAEKLNVARPPEVKGNRGYQGVGNEQIRGRLCMKESFGVENPQDGTVQNGWPSEDLLPGFRDFMERFFQECDKLIHRLLQCLSLALGLPAQFISSYHSRSLFNFDLIRYPAIPAADLHTGTLARMPAHSDFGTLTLLFQDGTGGLEIADLASANTVKSAEFERDGRFIPVDPKPGTVIVNVGYLLMRWSNGRWKNTIHRVVESFPSINEGRHGMVADGGTSLADVPEGELEDTRLAPARYSIPFFASPDPDTVLEALQGCWSEQNPKQWKPINTGEFLRRKREAS